MVKFLRNFFRVTAVAAAMACFPAQAGAEVLLSDNFDYNVGNLYGQGNWVKLSTNANVPIQVANTPLSFANYQPAPTGKAVVLDGGATSNPQRLQKGFADDGITSGNLFYSMLVKVNSLNSKNSSKYCLSGFSGKNFNGWGDGVGNTSIYGVVSVLNGTSDGKFKFGIAPSTSTPTYTAEFNIGETYLVVVKYDFSTKDIVLWVNPESASSAATVTLAGIGSISTTNGVQAICLYQQGSSLAQGNFTIDAVRVATTMAELFTAAGSGDNGDNGDEPGDQNPSVTVSATGLEFNAYFAGMTSPEVKTVTVTGSNLTAPLTISTTNPSFIVEPSNISVEDAQAGASVSVSFKPQAALAYSSEMKVTCGDTELASVQLVGSGIPVTEVPTLSTLSTNLFDGNVYNDCDYVKVASRFAVVTYVDKVGKRFFMQDMGGAVEVVCDGVEMPEDLKIGDKISSFVAMIESGFTGQQLHLCLPIEASAISAGTPKTPTAYSLSEVKASPESYWNKLITIEDAEFTSAGATFAASSTAATADGVAFSVRPFDGTNLIGTEIPAKASVSGIMIAKNGSVIWPRGASDVEAAPETEPTMTITKTLDFTEEAAPIGQTTRFATFTVTATDLPSAGQVWINGGNGTFTASLDAIPAGSGSYEVIVSYTPTAIGSNQATLWFDMDPYTLTETFSLKGYAYDPDNLPAITVPESVEAFAANVGEQPTKQITISSENMFAYGSVRIESQSAPGTFLINNTSLYPNINANFTITFKPQAAGDYTATIAVSAPKAETKYIYLTGTASGAVEEPTVEGDDIEELNNLTFENGNTLIIEHFDSAVKNKPLSLEGWLNVAIEGTRAWWGYTFDDNNGAAKCTLYDSKLSDPEEGQMMLISPLIDFKNSASKILTFRVMGDFLPQDGLGECPLMVGYIYWDEDFEEPGIEILDGFDFPVADDQNKTWQDYVVDFEDLPMPDNFYLVFAYLGYRYNDNSAVYYVDDFSWGRTDVPQIKVSHSNITMQGTVNTTTVSEDITVTGKNLSEDIALAMTGAHASKFATSTETLPAEGGNFAVHFTPEQEGAHEAYVELKSPSAPTTLIPVAATADLVSGISDIEAAASGTVTYNLQGIRVTRPSGIVIRRDANGHASKVFVK